MIIKKVFPFQKRKDFFSLWSAFAYKIKHKNNASLQKRLPDSLNGSEGGTRTHTSRGHLILSQARLPVPPLRRLTKKWYRGPDSNRHG